MLSGVLEGSDISGFGTKNQTVLISVGRGLEKIFLFININFVNPFFWKSDLQISKTPQSKSCVILAGTTHTVYALSCTVQSGYPV